MPLDKHGLEWIHPSAPLAHPFDDGTAAILERDLDATVASLGPDGNGYRRLFRPLVQSADAIFADVNQYAITWGAENFRDALVYKTKKFLGIDIDPEREISVSCGSTEAMIDVLLAVIHPGDEVIVFEPFYENYGPDAIISGATPRFVQLRRPDWSFDEKELAAAFNEKTKAIIINTPNNPTGKVFSREELQIIANLCQKWDVLAITDEIYEHIIYDGAKHISPITLDGMRERTIVVN